MLLFDSDVDDFDIAWSKMIEDHDLQDNEWLQRIYEKREKWAPTYVRNVFCAGKRTTQLSESFNSTLRRYLKTVMNMARFFQHFQKAIDDMRYKELKSNFDMQDKLPLLRTNDPLCIHASQVYTPNVFDLFMEQVDQVFFITLDCRRESNGSGEVEVHFCSPKPTHDCATAKRQVITTINGFHQCSCKYFNFVGVICCHIIWLLKQGRVCWRIPNEYILSRWTKKARLTIVPESTSNIMIDPELERVINRRTYMNLYASTIWKYGNHPESWKVLQRHHITLVDDLAQLTPIIKSGEIGKATDVTRSDEGLAIIAKGFKKREPKHRGNKRLKSALELRKKSRVGHKSSIATVSQPVARHLQLEDDLEVSSDDEEHFQYGRYRSLDDF
ncbi:Protein FAR1-RELATED SEQUENCE 5 [Morella rubra]|uniref:Protein FAR1-RELATED SEQUENCE n=1 Tax=Morella rubra TaxID=262757 RepID=A0A6A1WQZ7_9ROSI|nr:Protein FAR1-RELATED SEQUENCE 5 [Morella rubra]